MTQQGNLDPADHVANTIQKILGQTIPTGVKLSMPMVIIEDLVGDASVHPIQNPLDSDCICAAIVNITTVDATETMDVGLDSDGLSSSDTLLDALTLAAAGAFSSFSDADTGTNGVPWVQLDKKGGTNDYITFTASSGTDTVAGQLILILIPIGE